MSAAPPRLDPHFLSTLADGAELADAGTAWPADSWRALREGGVLGWSVPREFGGTGWSATQR